MNRFYSCQHYKLAGLNRVTPYGEHICTAFYFILNAVLLARRWS